jgi:hypothetical protein
VNTRFTWCLDQLAEKVRFGDPRENISFLYDSLLVLLIGNKSITYSQYRKACYELNNRLKTASNVEETNEVVFEVFQMVID